MSTQEKIALIEENLNLDEGTLNEDTILEEIDAYDSMARLSLIVMADDEFGIQLDGDTVKGFKTVADILAALGD